METILGSPALIILVGAIAPFLVALARSPTWPRWAVQTVVLIVAVVLGVTVLWVRIDAGEADVGWSAETVIGHAATVAVVGQAFYAYVLARAKGERPNDKSASPLARLYAKAESVGVGSPGASPGGRQTPV